MATSDNISSNDPHELLRQFELMGTAMSGNTQTTPSQIKAFELLLNRAEAIAAFSGPGADLDGTVKKMQQLMTTMNKAGVPVTFLNEQLTKMTDSAKLTTEVMKVFERSFRQVSKMSPQEFFGDNFKNNFAGAIKGSFPNIGKLLAGALDIGMLGEAVKLLGSFFNQIDAGAAVLNRAMYQLSVQSGNRGGSSAGIGGIFGRPAGSDPNIYKQLGETAVNFAYLNRSMTDFQKATATAAVLLPSSQERAVAPLTSIAAELATKFQMDLGQSITLVSELFRRGHSSGKSLVDAFDAIAKTSKMSNLSFQQGVDATTSLWNSTRLLGVNFDMANSTLRAYDTALSQGATTQQEITQMQSRQMEAPLSKVVGLISLADKLNLPVPGERPGDRALSATSRAGLFGLRMFGTVEGGRVDQAGLKALERGILGQAGALAPMGGDIGGRAASAMLVLQNLISQFQFLPIQTLGGAQRLLPGAIPGMPKFEGGGAPTSLKELAEQEKKLRDETHRTEAGLVSFTERMKLFGRLLPLMLAGEASPTETAKAGLSAFMAPGQNLVSTLAQNESVGNVFMSAYRKIPDAASRASQATINAPITIVVDLNQAISDVSKKVEDHLREVFTKARSAL